MLSLEKRLIDILALEFNPVVFGAIRGDHSYQICVERFQRLEGIEKDGIARMESDLLYRKDAQLRKILIGGLLVQSNDVSNLLIA